MLMYKKPTQYCKEIVLQLKIKFKNLQSSTELSSNPFLYGNSFEQSLPCLFNSCDSIFLWQCFFYFIPLIARTHIYNEYSANHKFLYFRIRQFGRVPLIFTKQLRNFAKYKASLLTYLLFNFNRYRAVLSFKLQNLIFKSKGPALLFSPSYLIQYWLHKIFLKNVVLLCDYGYLIPKFLSLKNSWNVITSNIKFKVFTCVSDNTDAQRVMAKKTPTYPIVEES